jgi:hypothetical protein
VGDQIVFIDYLRTWGTNKIIIDSNGLNYQGDPDTYTVEYDTNGETVNIVYADATKGWIPLNDDDVTDAPVQPPTQKAIFGFGSPGPVSLTNLVSSSGVVASDTTGVGTARNGIAAAGYGGDKAIFAYGKSGSITAISNLVSNSGVVATDVSGVGTARDRLKAACYGTDKAIFAYGNIVSFTAISNLVNNVGVVATDVSGVGTARMNLAASRYGADKAIFGFGSNGPYLSMTNLVTNVGVVGSDVTGVGTIQIASAACSYGGDKAIFGYGYTSIPGFSGYISRTNLISNVGVCSADVTGVGKAREYLAAAGYGGDKGIFGYGNGDPGGATKQSVTNLVSNTGVVATDTAGVGTARQSLAGAEYSFSA